MRSPRSLAVAALLVAAGGCTQIENPGKIAPGSPTVRETRSDELQRLQFSDVPVPRGFQLVTRGNRSFSFQGGGVRVGGFRYWGRTPEDEVVAFYRETMPLRAYAWRPVRVERTQDGSLLAFEKDRQTCEITVARESDATVVSVEVSGRGETP